MIFLDAEFTSNTQEVLELCITNEHGTILFHSYFKPRRARSWMLEPHHITPKKVRNAPYFSRMLPQLQRIISHADMVGGFAVDNDVRHLEAEGIDFSGSNILELREMYWALRNGCEDIDPYKIPGLTACATTMGVDVNPDTEHSAKGDTLVTQRLYQALAEALPQYPWETPQKAWDECHAYFQQGIVDFQREHARGYVWLKLLSPGHYKVVAKSIQPPEGEAEVCIEVADRHRALYEIRRRFQQRLNRAGYRLRPTDLQWFQKYTNEFDPTQSGIFKKLATSPVSAQH